MGGGTYFASWHAPPHHEPETMERVALSAFGWALTRGDAVVETTGQRKRRIQVRHPLDEARHRLD